MSITTVSPETEIPQHFASCTRDTIGGIVLKLIEQGRTHPHDLLFLQSMAECEQAQPGHCTCALTRLNAVKDQIRRTKKALKANGWSTSDTLVELTARRDALRELVDAR